jgi:uncharacterized protein (TIRG00374 family)
VSDANRRAAKLALQVCASVVLVAAVLWWAGPQKVVDAARQLDPWWALAALALNIAVTPLMAYRWRLLLQARRRPQPLSWLTGTYFVALLFGQVLPTAVGGDAVRIVDLARRSGEPAEAVSSVLVDRILGTAALVVLAAAGALAGGGGLGQGTVLAIELAIAAATAVAAWLVLSRSAQRVLRPLVPLARRLRIEGAARSVYRALHAYRGHPWTLLAVLALAVAAQALRVVVIALLAHGLGMDVSFGTFLLLGPVLFLVTIVPISLNGVGLREAAFVTILYGVGVSKDQAFVLGLAFFAVGLLTACVGGLVLLWRSLGPAGAAAAS